MGIALGFVCNAGTVGLACMLLQARVCALRAQGCAHGPGCSVDLGGLYDWPTMTS